MSYHDSYSFRVFPFAQHKEEEEIHYSKVNETNADRIKFMYYESR
jgi:hypothetical protein